MATRPTSWRHGALRFRGWHDICDRAWFDNGYILVLDTRAGET